MKQSFKVIVWSIVSILIIALVAGGGYFVYNNRNALSAAFSGAKIYTDEDIEDAYKRGVDDGTGEIYGFVDKINELLNEVNILESSLAQEKLTSESLKNNIALLNSYIAELEIIIAELKINNNLLSQQILILEEQKANLLETVAAYEQLLASIDEINNRFVVTFMFDDVVYHLLLVPDGEKVEIENPISTEYTIFHGWAEEPNGEIIDLTKLTITADTVLYAVITRKYDVNFSVNNTLAQHSLILKGSYSTAPIVNNTDTYNFLGWSLNGVDIIDPGTVQIYEHTTFFAVLDFKAIVAFISSASGFNTQTFLVNKGSALSDFAIQPEETSSYGFAYWYIDDINSPVDPYNYTFYYDTTFKAALYNKTIVIPSSAYDPHLCWWNSSELGTPSVVLTDFLYVLYPNLSYDNIKSVSGTVGLSIAGSSQISYEINLDIEPFTFLNDYRIISEKPAGVMAISFAIGARMDVDKPRISIYVNVINPAQYFDVYLNSLSVTINSYVLGIPVHF